MAASELPARIAARPLGEADLPAAMALVEEASWNQRPADWRIFLELGEATALTDAEGHLVATAATLPHGRDFGWISMVLVTTAWRRRGLARWLLGNSIAVLAAAGRVPLLDATPAGRTVYLGLGFHDAWELTRLVRRSEQPTKPARPDDVRVRALADADWPALTALDRAVFGGARAALLKRLAAGLPQAALVAERGGRPVGFLLGRDGRVMRQLGPLVAEDEAVARALLAAGLAALPGPLAIDLADRHGALGAWLGVHGFAPERPLTRMVLGREAAFDDPARYFAIAGPELG